MKYLIHNILFFLILQFYFSPRSAQAQEGDFIYFNKSYWADTMNMFAPIIKPYEDGYIAVGTYSTYMGHLYVRRLDEWGNTMWLNVLDIEESGEDFNGVVTGNQVTIASDGSIILVRSKEYDWEGEGMNIYLSKISSEGQFVWEKSFGSPYIDVGLYVEETSDNGFIISGAQQEEGMPGGMYVIKTDSEGELLWENVYDDSWGVAHCVREVWWDDGYVISGWISTEGDDYYDMHIVKLDEEGEMEWEHTISNYDVDSYALVVPTTYEEFLEGKPLEYLVLGALYNAETGNYDQTLFRLDWEGELVWQKTFYDEEDMIGSNTYPLVANGKLYTVMHYESPGLQHGNKLICVNVEEGKLEWVKNLPVDEEGNVYLRDINFTPDGGMIIGGFQSWPPPQKGIAIKVDMQGNTCWPADCDSLVMGTSVQELKTEEFALIKVLNSPLQAGEDLVVALDLGEAEWRAGMYLEVVDQYGRTTAKKALVNGRSSYHFSSRNLGGGMFIVVLKEGDRVIANSKVLRF